MRLAENYMDYNATTPMHEEVLESMVPWMKGIHGNASSMHSWGREAARAVAYAREQVAAFIGAHPEEIFFTSGATEAINLALRGLTEACFPKGSTLLSQTTEHKAVLDTLEALREKGYPSILVPYQQMEHFIQHMHTCSPAMAVCMWANNETGEIFPVEKIAQEARNQGVMFFSDATQAAGKIPLNMKNSSVHALCFSGHKIYGPQGIGILYLRRRKYRIHPVPQITGGGHQEGIRSGTLPVALIVGMGKACEVAARELENRNRHTTEIRNYFEEQIKKNIPQAEIVALHTERISNTSCIVFPGTLQHIGILWDNFAFSSGAACTSEKPQPSHVLLSMGYEKEKVKNSYRFSFGRGKRKRAGENLIKSLIKHLS